MSLLSKLTFNCNKWKKVIKDHETYYCLSSDYKRHYVIADNTADAVKNKIESLEKEFPDIKYLEKMYDLPIIKYEVEEENNYDNLPIGIYTFKPSDYSSCSRLVKSEFRNDFYLNISKKTEEINDQVDKFITNEQIYRNLNIIYKMGILLYGPPGEGKTSLIRNFVNNNKKFKESIIINVNISLPDNNFLSVLNESTKDILKVFIIEELTELTSQNRGMEEVLTFLDGESSVDNCIVFATTNYPEKLPQNIVNRPSRFDKLYKISSLSKEEKKQLITYFYGKEPSQEFLDKVEGYSSAFIKEICINALLNNISLEDSIKVVSETFEVVKRDFRENKIGF